MTPTENNPYEAPRAALDTGPSPGLSLSLEGAIAGRYSFTIGEVMEEAWELVKGMKASFWGAAIVIGVLYLAFNTLIGFIAGRLVTGDLNVWLTQVIQGLVAALMTPITMGLQMMCVRRALGLPVSFATAFSYFHRAGTALVGALLVLVLTYAGFLLLILPGIYLYNAYSLTTALICDAELPAWRAMETSRKAITRRWWSVFGLMLLVGLLTGLSALALLIPLIWTVPWSMMTSAVLYKRIFHAAAPSPIAAPVLPGEPARL